MKNDVEGNADRGVTPPIDSMTPRSAFFFVLSTPPICLLGHVQDNQRQDTPC